MAYSTTTLVKLQRLARAAKKELNLVTQLSSESGIAALMTRVSTEHSNNTIVVLFEDFKATLTAEDKVMLSSSGAIDSSLPTQDAIEEEEHLHERVYRGVVIHDDAPDGEIETHDTAETPHRKQRMYRGVVIEDDAENVIETEQRVKTEAEVQARIQAQVDAQVKLKMAALEKTQTPTEKLIKFPNGTTTTKPAAKQVAKPMRKQIGMYRGQPIYEDIE